MFDKVYETLVYTDNVAREKVFHKKEAFTSFA